MEELDIGEGQMVQDIQAALGLTDVVEDPDAMTLTQMMRSFGVTRRVAQGRARRAVEAGKLERIHVWRPTADNSRLVVMIAYRTPDR